ncbi:hypothetical protein CSB20_05770 [bacterium DOLZORAL124_64_63]|nr:MAG: hypothetical protein CSB20_05770 [bacterium DOLZORAL124_64_63]
MEGQRQPIARARQRSQEATRIALIEAATGLFAAHGIAGTRTADIARAAGVAVGTVYLHFKDKDALLKAVLKLALGRLKQELIRFPPSSATPVQDKMVALASFTENFPDLASVLFDGGNLSTIPGQEALDFLTQSQERGLQEGVTKGYYRGDLNRALAARAMVGSLVQVLRWWAKHPEMATRQEVIKALTVLRLEGLGVR